LPIAQKDTDEIDRFNKASRPASASRIFPDLDAMRQQPSEEVNAV